MIRLAEGNPADSKIALLEITRTNGRLRSSEFLSIRDYKLELIVTSIPADLPQIALYSPQFHVSRQCLVYANANTKEYQWQINEQVNYTLGRHALSFGFDFDWTNVKDFYAGNFNGSYTFYNLPAFALGQYGTFTQSVGNPLFPFSFPYYGFYVQDKFQLSKRLTHVSLGLPGRHKTASISLLRAPTFR